MCQKDINCQCFGCRMEICECKECPGEECKKCDACKGMECSK